MAEHVGLLRSSASPFIQDLFADTEAEAAAEAAANSGARARRGTKSAFKLNSVGAQFRKQLQVGFDPAPAKLVVPAGTCCHCTCRPRKEGRKGLHPFQPPRLHG